MTERGSGDPTPVDLASEINAIVTGVRTEEQHREEGRGARERKESEERTRREAEISRHNERLRQKVQETGIREIFVEARDALAQHYPDVKMTETWSYSDGLYLHNSPVLDTYRYHQYSISLRWNYHRSSLRESWSRTVVDYDIDENSLRIDYHKLGEDERQDTELLKRILLKSINESIRKPTKHEYARPSTGLVFRDMPQTAHG